MSDATLLTLARRALVGEALPEGRILAAVSGGADSMALLHALGCLAGKLGLAVVAHGVDHGLRAEASGELDLAEGLAAKLGISFSRTRLHLAAGGNLQARAREARHRALVAAALAAGARTIATAHHADDRAETVLLRLLRGAGPHGLAALPPRAPAFADGAITLVRPLLRARRTHILAHLERHRLAWAEDPSNRDTSFLRVRVRNELLPRMVELDPGIVDHLTSLADALAELRVPASGEGGIAANDEPAWICALPRATRAALRGAAKARAATARVWLPGGFVVTVAENVDAEAGKDADNQDARKEPRTPTRGK